jgi:hypothetical protein
VLVHVDDVHVVDKKKLGESYCNVTGKLCSKLDDSIHLEYKTTRLKKRRERRKKEDRRKQQQVSPPHMTSTTTISLNPSSPDHVTSSITSITSRG